MNDGLQESVLGTYDDVDSALRGFLWCCEYSLNSGEVEDKKHKEDLTFVKTGTSCLLKALENIKASRSVDIVATQIRVFAQNLELLLAKNIDHELNSILNNSIKSHYQRLHCLHLDFRVGKIRDIEPVRKVLNSDVHCKYLYTYMAKLCDELERITQRDADDDDEEESATQSVIPYDREFYHCADSAFKAIACQCKQKEELEIRLRLGTFPSQARVQTHRSVDILLQCKDKKENVQFWLAMCIHTSPGLTALEAVPQKQVLCEKTPQLRVTFTTPVGDECPWREDEPIGRDCICWYARETTSGFKTFLHHVELDEEGWQQHDCYHEGDIYPTDEYSLPTLFSQMSWTDVDKIVLAMQLAHALAYFYGDNWLAGRWQGPNIRFFRWGSRIPCKPWLEVPLPPKSALQDLECNYHLFPQILELGIVMLELSIGQPLESYPGEKTPKNLNDRWVLAKKILQNHSFLSVSYKEAIDFCFKPKFGSFKAREALEKPEVVREFVYKEVVVRLERIIKKSKLEIHDLEGLDLGRISRTFPSKPNNTSQPPKQNDIERNEVTTVMDAARAKLESAQVLQNTVQEELMSELEEGFDLFGDEKGFQPCKDSDDSKSWLDRLTKNIKERIGKSSSQPPGGHRVKVAILDTGIDLNHSYFDGEYKAGRIQNIASFVDGKNGDEDKNCSDESGHGTFVASLLLSHGPHIDLYVAKVSKSRAFKKGTIENVKNALYHARAVWEVDIITISFGFPRGIRDIWEQITLATQKNILVFAAASNDGLDQSRMYPASQDSVFAIHSTTCKGVASGFNPQAERDENFSILGEYVESAWLTKDGGSGSTRILSGTSFATPIAVCLAAFIILYVPTIVPEHKTLLHDVKSYVGMKRIFQSIVADPSAKYQYISLRKFMSENNQSEIYNAIKKALSR